MYIIYVSVVVLFLAAIAANTAVGMIQPSCRRNTITRIMTPTRMDSLLKVRAERVATLASWYRPAWYAERACRGRRHQVFSEWRAKDTV